MKKIFSILVLLLSFVVWQGCSPKNPEVTTESTDAAQAQADEIKKAEALAARKARRIEESAKKADERAKAAAEKAKLSLTFKDANGKTVYNKAEVDPTYTGGMDEMRKYLRDNLKYPTEARENGVEGTVFVDFVIDEKGKVREVVASDIVGEDVDFTLKEESVRVVASMPGWNAGLQHGKAVDTYFSIPITFEILN
jgi:TonB family protein